MAINIKTYHLRHPELNVPAVAEFRGFWLLNGRNVGLRLRFQGEDQTRCLTYFEVAELSVEEEELPPC